MSTLMEVDTAEQLRRDILPVVQRAGTIVVRTADDRAEAKAFLVAVKRAQDQAHATFDESVDKAHKSWKAAVALRASFLTPLEEAEKAIKGIITAYDGQQERIRQEEQRRLQAITDEAARKERQKAEQEADKQRAIQEAKKREAAEARRKAEEAEGAERKRLLAEAEAAERKAATAAAKVEVKEEQAAAIIAPTVIVNGPEKSKGESMRKLWKARLVDKAALIQAAAQGSEFARACLEFDQTTANRMATATKGAVVVPGIEFYANTILAMRSDE